MNKTKDIAASPLCFVSPYPQLAKAAEALVAQLDYAVTIHQTTLNRILDELPLLESRGHQVLISRGGCAEILKKHSKLPVVEIKMSGYDILDALIPFKGQKGTVGIVGFSSVIKGCARVAEQLNINYKILPYREMIKKRFLPEATISVHAIRLHCWRYRLSGLFFTAGLAIPFT